MQARKEELQQTINKARAELQKIEHDENEKVSKTLVGRYFRTKNSYSCPDKKTDYWWTYGRVVSCDGMWVKVDEFEICKDGRFLAKPSMLMLNSFTHSWAEIRRGAYNKALMKFKKRLNREFKA